MRLINSEPLSQWKPSKRNGNGWSIAIGTGIRCLSEMVSTQSTTCLCVTVSTALMWNNPASPSWLPWCTVSTRGLPPACAARARAGCGRLPCRAGYKCETEMPASRTDSFFPNTSWSRCVTRRIAGPDRSSCAASTPASRAMSAAVYLRGKLAPTSWFALDTPGLHPASDPSGQLRSAQSGHLC